MDAAVSHLWQSTLVACVAAMLAWWLRHHSAAVRCWIWAAASMKFLVPFAALSWFVNMLPWPDWQTTGSAIVTVNTLFTSSALPPVSRATSGLLAVIWLTGTLVVMAGWMWKWCRIADIAQRSTPIRSGSVHDALRRIEHVAGVSMPITIVSSPAQLEPGVFGISTPVVLWPAHLTGRIREEHVEPIIAHEICHVIRRDNLIASVHMLTLAMFWFHPLVWWIGARLIAERERACDEHVLELGQQPAPYAAAILETCELCIAAPLANLAGISGGDLKWRIVRIMNPRVCQPMGPLRKAILTGAALVMLVLPVAAGACAGPTPIPAENEVALNPERPGPGVQLPKLVREVKPQYSARAIQEKIQGEVVMECVVGIDGKPSDVKVIRPLDPDLDQAALDAAKLWEFEPGTRSGKPVPVIVTVTMGFTLK
jgi:TonB family protein